jgi:Flp pilus assembly protein TadD
MILALLVALSAATAPPLDDASIRSQLEEAQRAGAAGRLDQARLMISKAIAAGASEADADRAIGNVAFDARKFGEALAAYQQVLTVTPKDGLILERAGISAIEIGDRKVASELIGRAVESPAATWRAWNARGALADYDRDWSRADAAYAKAAALAPDQAEVANNRGWSLILRGDWANAVSLFERAARADPKNERMANNLQLAQSALAAELPRRQAGEPDRDWAARLNDAGVAAQLLGDRKRAIAAFTQALEASGSWYERAANNLEGANGR